MIYEMLIGSAIRAEQPLWSSFDLVRRRPPLAASERRSDHRLF
jgi:hypothetical protein